MSPAVATLLTVAFIVWWAALSEAVGVWLGFVCAVVWPLAVLCLLALLVGFWGSILWVIYAVYSLLLPHT